MTEKQEKILNYLRITVENKGRPPRLKELSAEFEMPNKSILDQLSALQKEGFISMPEGVLSIKILKKYQNDIFLSYSNENKEVAERVYKYFEDEGFNVWKDNLIKNGESYVEEIFDNIKGAKTVVLLLSDKSLDSKFVKKEIECALAFQIERGRPLVLPLNIDTNLNKDKIFPEIKAVQYEKYDHDQPELSLIKLADRIHMFAYEHRDPALENKSIKTNSTLESFWKKVCQDLNSSKELSQQIAFKNVLISPIESFKYPKNQLEELIIKSLVKIQGWGGDRFPAYYGNYGKNPVYVSDGIRSPVDDNVMGFYYWKIDDNLNFFSQCSLREDDRSEKPKNKISVELLTFDVARPILFVKNLMELTGKSNWKIKFRFNGFGNRELIVLSSNRFGFHESYKCSENSIEKEYVINMESNLKELAFEICYDLFLLFQWRNPNAEMLRKDIDTFFEGKFV